MFSPVGGEYAIGGGGGSLSTVTGGSGAVVWGVATVAGIRVGGWGLVILSVIAVIWPGCCIGNAPDAAASDAYGSIPPWTICYKHK